MTDNLPPGETLVLDTSKGTFVEVPLKSTRPRQNLSGIEQERLEKALQLLQSNIETLKRMGVHETFYAGVIEAYEKMLDATLYGYPGAVFDGWEAR